MPVSAPQRPASPGSDHRSHPFAATAPDTTLVGLAARGDERAFELLFQRHRPDVQAYATRMLRDHGRAEDVVQDVFVSAMRAIRGAAPELQPVHVRAWLREIARKACIDQWRGAARRGEVSLDAPDALRADDVLRLSDDSLTRATDDRHAVATLRRAFDDLPELQHAVLVQRELEGRSIPEIADRLGLTATVVEGQLARARRTLGQSYRELDSGERCVAVRALCDSAVGGRLGVRDRHRLGSHVRGCDGCRRYARSTGVDARLIDRAHLSRASLLLPLPLLRRLPLEPGLAGEAAGGVLGAKALVGAAVLAAGGGGAYVAAVEPGPSPAPPAASAGSRAASPFGVAVGADGRPVVRVAGSSGPLSALPVAGGARPFLPPWLVERPVGSVSGGSVARRGGPAVADPAPSEGTTGTGAAAPSAGPATPDPGSRPGTPDQGAPASPDRDDAPAEDAPVAIAPLTPPADDDAPSAPADASPGTPPAGAT
ncbi:RNA polymerase sigma factor, partial [Patulibacter sp.]|uniref:RNA polymerase sigma factor n=1 Tax=Patulibacter sp. TaxID=1912859 RepID=UPI002720D9EB